MALLKIELRSPGERAAARRYRIGSIVTTTIFFILLLWITAQMWM